MPASVVLFLMLAIVAQAADARVPSLKKGVANTVKSMTTLVGSIADPILKLDNNGTGTALQIDVGSGNPPLVVNDDAGTAINLKAEDANTLDGNNSTDFLGATQQAADSDKLDGKEPGQLPGSIASVTTINTFPGIPFDLGTSSAGRKFVGSPETGITTTSSQRLVGTAEVPLGDPTATSINYDLCYRPSVGGMLTNFSADPSSATLTTTDVVYTATSSVTPGAGTWDVGFCVIQATNDTRDAQRVSYVNGWVMVVNQ
jgi:hypothetical protein